MNAAYATDSAQPTRAGGAIIVAVSIVSALLVILGLYYAAGTGERHKVALAGGGCEPNLSPSGLPCTTAQVLASRYTTITTPVIQQLNTDVAAYNASERHHRVAAEAAIRAEVTLENTLGAELARFPFPPAVTPKAKALIEANRALAALSAEQARSSSFGQLWSFNNRIRVARAAEETEIGLLGKALHSPPTAIQEP